MTLENFIPEVWSARLLENLNNAHVYANLCNRDYEGEVKALGDTVKINSVGNPTIGDYTKNSDIAAAETLTDAQTTLAIDTAHYFNFQVDDVDKVQGKPKVMNSAMENAAWGLSDKVDTSLAGLHSAVPAGNKIGADAASAKFGLILTAGSAMYDYLVDLKTILDDNNCPDDGRRWAVFPNWAEGAMLKDSRFVNATELGNQVRTRGLIAQAAGFNIYKSNNITNDAQTVKTYRVLAGHPNAWSLVEQIIEVEAYRPQLRFADAVKGLLVYGKKVVRPSLLACLYVKNAAS
jgi:hypothetical protein